MANSQNKCENILKKELYWISNMLLDIMKVFMVPIQMTSYTNGKWYANTQAKLPMAGQYTF